MSQTKRREVASGARPRIDVLDMQSQWGADLHDFTLLLEGGGVKRRILRFLGNRFSFWSVWLALDAYSSLRKQDVVYASGEDVGLPFALMLRAFRAKKPTLVIRMEQPTYGKTWWRRLLFN